MPNLSIKNSKDWRSANKYILNLPEISFVEVMRNMDGLIVGDYSKGIIPIAKIEHYKRCMEHILELFMKIDLVECGGKQN